MKNNDYEIISTNIVNYLNKAILDSRSGFSGKYECINIVAKRCKVSFNTIIAWIEHKSKPNPTLKILLNICKGLDIEFQDLLIPMKPIILNKKKQGRKLKYDK